MRAPLISPPYSSASLWKQNYVPLPPDGSVDMMPLWATPPSLTMFEGEKQPPPNERLEQIRTFLADEDYHRNLNFRDKLEDIERYVEFLERNHYKADGDKENRLLDYVKKMIYIHKAWVRKATEVPSLSFRTGRFSHQNRLVHMIENVEKQKEIINTRAPKLSRELVSSGPALHKVIDDRDRPPSPDPFLYTKQVAEIRRRQDTMASKLQGNSPPVNFNGPYTLLSGERRTFALGDKVQTHEQLSTIRDFNGRVNAAVGSIIDIAQPLDPEAELTEIHAASLLQKQILTEHYHNWGSRTPNYSKLWGFADGVQNLKTFFSLDRWPLELQSPKQRDKIRQSGPKPYTLAKIESQDRKPMKSRRVAAHDPNERYIRGKTLFPFGETQIQAARKSQMINRILANAPSFADVHAKDRQGKEDMTSPTAPADLLALPKLPEEQQEEIAEAFQKLSSEASNAEDTDSEYSVESLQPLAKRRRVI